MDTGRSVARRTRALRGSAAAAVATTIAATAHTLSGGGAPPLWLLIAVTALAAPVSVALVGQRRSIVRLGIAVLAAQAVLHVAFSAVGTSAPAGLSSPRGAHDHAAMALSAASTGTAAAMTATMAAGHVLAALATIVLLAFGERMLAAIARGIRHLLPRLPAADAPRPTAPLAAAHTLLAAIAAAFLTSVGRRGPPALAR